jgi:hypothetical protein
MTATLRLDRITQTIPDAAEEKIVFLLRRTPQRNALKQPTASSRQVRDKQPKAHQERNLRSDALSFILDRGEG